MKVNKWNNVTREYEPHDVPDDWNISAFSNDMNGKINCVRCGKRIRYGDGYTSRRFHTPMGFGYIECEQCYYANKEV